MKRFKIVTSRLFFGENEEVCNDLQKRRKIEEIRTVNQDVVFKDNGYGQIESLVFPDEEIYVFADCLFELYFIENNIEELVVGHKCNSDLKYYEDSYKEFFKNKSINDNNS